MQAAILAGGLATRLGELTKHQPKSMLPIMGKSFLEYQLALLASEGIGNVVLCIGHLGEQIVETFGTGKEFGLNIEYSYEAVLQQAAPEGGTALLAVLQSEATAHGELRLGRVDGPPCTLQPLPYSLETAGD